MEINEKSWTVNKFSSWKVQRRKPKTEKKRASFDSERSPEAILCNETRISTWPAEARPQNREPCLLGHQSVFSPCVSEWKGLLLPAQRPATRPPEGPQVNWSCVAGWGADHTDGMPPISNIMYTIAVKQSQGFAVNFVKTERNKNRKLWRMHKKYGNLMEKP